MRPERQKEGAGLRRARFCPFLMRQTGERAFTIPQSAVALAPFAQGSYDVGGFAPTAFAQGSQGVAGAALPPTNHTSPYGKGVSPHTTMPPLLERGGVAPTLCLPFWKGEVARSAEGIRSLTGRAGERRRRFRRRLAIYKEKAYCHIYSCRAHEKAQ